MRSCARDCSSAIRRSISPRRSWEYSECRRPRTGRSPTATGWKSIAPWSWTRRKRGAGALSAMRGGSASLAAPVAYALARFRDLAGALVVVDEVALAVRVGAPDPLAALQHPQLLLRGRAVGALRLLLLRRLFVLFAGAGGEARQLLDLAGAAADAGER